MAFTKGLNALNTAARNLDLIGNNVANANTVGFKAGQLYFSEVLANARGAGPGNTPGLGGGATDLKVLPQFSQGNIESTNNPLDLAINGQGLFIVKGSGSAHFTRAGQFKLDDQGYIATPVGGRLQGFAVDDAGKSMTADVGDLRISTDGLPPRATETGTLQVVLDSRMATADPAAFRLNDPATYQHATSMSIHDSQGNEHALAVYFVKAASDRWDVFAGAEGGAIGSGPVGSLYMQSNGTIDGARTTLPFALTVPVQGGDPVPMVLDLGGSLSLGRDFSIVKSLGDGQAAGQLNSYAVDADGFVIGRYTNGSTQKLGQVALAVFSNPQGLQAIGSNGFIETPDSGAAEIVGADHVLAGAIQSGALEKSNVDLTQELVRMIEAQRVYQANAQAIKVQDAIIQAVENLR